MPLYYFLKIHLYSGIVLLLFACSSKNNDVLVSSLEESLENSNKAINMSSETILRSLKDKAQDPASMERASIWFSKAEQIEKLSKEASAFIEGLKKLKDVNSAKANELFILLKKYKADVLNVDSSIRYEFANSISALPYSIDSSENGGKEFASKYFSTSNPVYTSAMLTKLQNSIKNIENKTLAYCHDKIGSTDGKGFFDSFALIIGQSNNNVKSGDKIEITAGLGVFSGRLQPEITINGKVAEINEEGIAVYKFKAPQKTGRYFVPVKSIFISPSTGKPEIHETIVEYSVAAPCN